LKPSYQFTKLKRNEFAIKNLGVTTVIKGAILNKRVSRPFHYCGRVIRVRHGGPAPTPHAKYCKFKAILLSSNNIDKSV
jgi:hypothetical protein